MVRFILTFFVFLCHHEGSRQPLRKFERERKSVLAFFDSMGALEPEGEGTVVNEDQSLLVLVDLEVCATQLELVATNYRPKISWNVFRSLAAVFLFSVQTAPVSDKVRITGLISGNLPYIQSSIGLGTSKVPTHPVNFCHYFRDRAVELLLLLIGEQMFNVPIFTSVLNILRQRQFIPRYVRIQNIGILMVVPGWVDRLRSLGCLWSPRDWIFVGSSWSFKHLCYFRKMPPHHFPS